MKAHDKENTRERPQLKSEANLIVDSPRPPGQSLHLSHWSRRSSTKGQGLQLSLNRGSPQTKAEEHFPSSSC